MTGIESSTFESLWNDFERRTWHYDYLEPTLGISNPRLRNWIGSIDQSGYTREKCLRALIANPEPGDENRILLRLSDWVAPIRAVARVWVLDHFQSLSMGSIRANQRMILYLSRKDRLRDDPGMRHIELDLQARAKAMSSSEFFRLIPMFRRFLFSLSLKRDEELRSLIPDDPEPFNRLLLSSKVQFAELTKYEKQRLRADKSVFVRRRLFYTERRAGVRPAKDELVALAIDPNRSLRQLGQYYLKSDYGEDVRNIYRAQEGEEFFHIADYAQAEDAEHFLEGVRCASRSTQLNCLRALISAAPKRLKELDIPRLIEQNRRFRSSLVPLLPNLLTLEEILDLRPVFVNNSPLGSISFFKLLEKKSFWAFVDEGLGAILSEPEPALRKSIVQAINSKVAISQSLSPQFRESISGKISQLREHNSKQFRAIADLLEFTMRTA